MNKIIINSMKTCQLDISDKVIFNKIRNRLSFIQEGFEYSAAGQQGWNGQTFLITPKGKFNYPLIEKVKNLLNEFKCDFELEDKRSSKSLCQPLDISGKLKELGMVPRDYQQEAANTIANHDVGIMRLCTGSGKTNLAAMMTASIGKPTLILVIGIDLLYSFHELFSSIFNEPIGMIGDGKFEVTGARIYISTVWTLAKALKIDKKDLSDDDGGTQAEKFEETNSEKMLKILSTIKLVILDECHIVGCKSSKTLLKNIDYEHLYGLSGTPFKNTTDDLEIINLLGEKIADVSSSFLIGKKVLPQPIIKFLNVPAIGGGYGKTYAEVYRSFIVDNDLRNSMILNNAKQLLNKKYRILVLFKTIDHGKIIFDMFKDSGIKCVLLSGKDNIEKREVAKDKINNGEIDVIIASTIFDIGISINALSALILAGGGGATGIIKTMQRVGRLLRSYPGKTSVAVVDFYDNIRYLKGHSVKRLNAYKEEPAFKLILPANLK